MSNSKKQTYKGNGSHMWEEVAIVEIDGNYDETMRLRVPGGWLYHNEAQVIDPVTGETRVSRSMVFVPLPAVLVQGKGETSKGKHAL